MFFKIPVPNSGNYTGKYLCWSLLLIKLHAWPAALLKKGSNTGFSCKISGIYKGTFFYRTPSVATSVTCHKIDKKRKTTFLYKIINEWLLILILFRMEGRMGGWGAKRPPYQFFPCNFCKCKNYRPKRSDFWF